MPRKKTSTGRGGNYLPPAQMLARLPATMNELSEALGRDRAQISMWLQQFWALGTISRSRDGAQFVWSLEPSTPHQRAGRSYTNVLRVAKALEAARRRVSLHQIADSCGVKERQALIIVKAIRQAGGLLRIAGWENHSTALAPIYDRVRGADAPRPAPKTRLERDTEYRLRKRARAAANDSIAAAAA